MGPQTTEVRSPRACLVSFSGRSPIGPCQKDQRRKADARGSRSCPPEGGLFEAISQVHGLESVRVHALRFLDVHPLTAADSVQLAAAFVAAKEHPQDLPFVTLDRRQAEAASKEGFSVEIAG